MMEHSGPCPNRREFMAGIIPACALACLGCSDAFATTLAAADPSAAANSSFEQELTISHKELFEYRYKRDFIPVFQAIAADIGKEEVLEMIRKASSLNNHELGERIAKARPSNDFHTFAEPFRNPRGVFKQANIYEIVEDTEAAFEVRFSGCLTATVFRESDAADIGYAAVCHADFALPQAFNPHITLVRDKTLMQGHDCCNHRYVWQG